MEIQLDWTEVTVNSGAFGLLSVALLVAGLVVLDLVDQHFWLVSVAALRFARQFQH
jgi:hypothetical protein